MFSFNNLRYSYTVLWLPFLLCKRQLYASSSVGNLSFYWADRKIFVRRGAGDHTRLWASGSRGSRATVGGLSASGSDSAVCCFHWFSHIRPGFNLKVISFVEFFFTSWRHRFKKTSPGEDVAWLLPIPSGKRKSRTCWNQLPVWGFLWTTQAARIQISNSSQSHVVFTNSQGQFFPP